MTSTRCDRSAAWSALQTAYAQKGQAFDLRQAFAQDAGRFAALSQSAPHVFADLSKNLIDDTTQQLLLELARQTGVAQHRDAMFAGERINSTEERAVMHWLLRTPPIDPAMPAQSVHRHMAETLHEVHRTLDAMLAFAEVVRADERITDIVNIGIGGSDLGPQMAVLALDAFVLPGKRFHFVSNVDGHELAGVLSKVKPESTLFLIASKTFTTIETMTNAESAKRWFLREGGTDIGRHFAALTTNVAAANDFGVKTTFGFWDWVGGRYSVWSAIGLPLAIAIGAAGFRQFLAGAHAMDEHFRSAPLERNLPVRLGLLDVWYRNFHGFTSRSIAPYHSALKRYPAYLQQLEMESNGKRVDANGEALPYDTAPVLWGEPGTNGQHAYFQMLHQGTDVVPVEFVAVKHPKHDLPGHHDLLLANALAQAQALMVGKSADAGPPQGGAAPPGGSDPHAMGERGGHVHAGGHKDFPGNRPSTFLLLDELSPASLGALIALQEHRVFVSGSVWGINSFDQWGVELGKVLARDVAARLAAGNVTGLDGSTAGLLARLRD
ncbi:MAG: glucose-6-phosphate isomerase [Gammaproteobacteria bacterium]|uniref:glucose-6-phosphate isomerase n=1 Tax=Rhodoferax sp. TaxID=50421 RepID=UPI001826A6D1|nr:glucose-6-phosphate isomerase [Rhodoferax sp.]MBU3897829.1 glucose-6-phosphate isomerase [Gammaproteobacteria bacterium]MBA3059222.1 glucose-6-phosphate isomerase [Rhodoferax sp.]MBU3997295.1 glucose-6-phosphate isomerase [Gammaproteobacteria bacterium]MBU4017904.1 glucose-6-phosphate isomerase [Gammaproteobacteria bacterium]MBU4078641.1 glucose-6-phosphate isomerase [Gammaproteobacteria bacterium]